MKKVVKIEDCWMTAEYNNHNRDKIQNGELPSGDEFMVYFLRFLLFCDQCHDFCKDADRNNWIHNVKGKEDIKKKIYKIIKDGYAQDIQSLGGRTAIQLDGYGIGPGSIETAWRSTRDMKDIIDKLLKNAFGIEVVGSSAAEAQDGCSMASKRLLQKVDLVPGAAATKDSPYIIAVDADQSRFKLSTLLNYICDITIDKNIRREVNLCDMASTKYDSASGSGALNFIKAIKANYENTDNIKIKDIVDTTELELTFRGTTIIHMIYDIDTNVGDKIDSENWEERRLKIKKDVKDINRNTELSYWPASKQEIYDDIKEKGIIVPYSKPGTSSDKRYEWKRNRITPGDLKKLAQKSPSITLNIKKFFSRNNEQFEKLNDVINSENSSVSSLTSNYDINNDKWKPEIGIDPDSDPKGKGLNNLVNIMCYKTLGDFGQILEYNSLTSNLTRFRNLFITFDTICSRISSLFNRYTIFESSDIAEQGVTMFLPEYINTAILGVRGLGPGPSRTEAADGLMKLKRARTSEFGKKPKVSIRNTSTRVLKAKLKSVGVPITKVVRGKRMKLTRKELEMRAQAFKRLQIRCQKKGINLTYVSKKGRKYKSAKRLLSDLKRQPKSKPKKNVKPKMKWG
tara:strand:- start:3489 stop:5366 length:1878 start_codon:yes stop_codon:yes gene_type:complete